MEGQLADRGVEVGLASVAFLCDVMGRPAVRRGVAVAAKLGDQLAQILVVGMAGGPGAQQRDGLPRPLVPVGVKRARGGVAEHEPRVVALGAERSEQRLGGRVPDQQVEAAAEDNCGRRLQAAHEQREPGAHLGAGAAVGCGLACGGEAEQMPTLGCVEQQGASQRLEDAARRTTDPSLLEANDVIDAHVRQPGEFLAPQAGHAAPNTDVEPGEFR